MSIFYNMSRPCYAVVKMIQDGELPGLTYAAAQGDEFTAKLWPHGVTDGVNYGWFEDEDIILFWGKNDPTKILTALRAAGISVWFGG